MFADHVATRMKDLGTIQATQSAASSRKSAAKR
jgi:hypothetical protein